MPCEIASMKHVKLACLSVYAFAFVCLIQLYLYVLSNIHEVFLVSRDEYQLPFPLGINTHLIDIHPIAMHTQSRPNATICLTSPGRSSSE